jgi:3-deoxy-D-manno-octulosonate 8-phosphate phosphatase (KDO 8-P phosphatase)
MSESRAKKIKLILFDVDGVLTDGLIFLVPVPAGEKQGSANAAAGRGDQTGIALQSQNAIEVKGFHAHDGTGFSLARLAGMKAGIITKRISETVALRARDLKMEFVSQGAADKATAFLEIVAQAGLKQDEVAFVGDDIIDLPAMRLAGLAIATANARDEVKREAHFVTERRGGEGAGRDAVEYILRAKGVLEQVSNDYMADRASSASSTDVGGKR